MSKRQTVMLLSRCGRSVWQGFTGNRYSKQYVRFTSHNTRRAFSSQTNDSHKNTVDPVAFPQADISVFKLTYESVRRASRFGEIITQLGYDLSLCRTLEPAVEKVVLWVLRRLVQNDFSEFPSRFTPKGLEIVEEVKNSLSSDDKESLAALVSTKAFRAVLPWEAREILNNGPSIELSYIQLGLCANARCIVGISIQMPEGIHSTASWKISNLHMTLQT